MSKVALHHSLAVKKVQEEQICLCCSFDQRELEEKTISWYPSQAGRLPQYLLRHDIFLRKGGIGQWAWEEALIYSDLHILYLQGMI